MVDGKGRPASPPTDRAIAVVELLAARRKPVSAAEVADALGLSRSTVGAILGTLADRAWVRRLPDLTYEPGPRLAAIALTCGRLAAPDGADEAIRGLSERVGCGVALGLVTPNGLTFVAVTAGEGRLPAGITTGTVLPLRAPAGAASVAFSSRERQREWLATAPPDCRAALAEVLEQIRADGVALWGIDAAAPAALDVLAEVVEHLSDNPASQDLRGRVLALLADISGRPYGAADVTADAPLPLSHLVAPVFDAAGRATWELQVGPLRAAVGRAERRHYMTELRRTADRLSQTAR
ncbi:helix-turn-helix domain-containing protein [Actinomadura miaoliensis]|uniref:MarR family transcriptional regulator n=1 Tax=Actinomadura miaoliensis TaxID=430685 RepID=A0ABP7UZC3_9ACTN